MAEHHAPVSVSLRKTTLAELREVAERRRTSASKVAEAGISDYLRTLRADSLNGGRPLVRVTPKEAEPDPSEVRAPAWDPEIWKQMSRAVGSANMPTTPKRPRRRRMLGALFVLLPAGIPFDATDRLQMAIEREARLILSEENGSG